MLKRQTSGSVVCPSCGRLVGVQEDVCPHCGRASPGLWGFSRVLQVLGQDVGFVKLIIGSCAVLYLLTLVTNPSGIGTGGAMSMLSPSSGSLFLFGASGAVPVFGYNRWWTILSASWLHGSLLHILFNMLWVRQLAPATARLYGPGRMMLIYIVSGAAGFLLSSTVGAYGNFLLPPFLRGANLTIGASASIFGLLGALVYYGRVFGFIMPGIDNFAHLGGFLGGYGMSRVLNPFKPEKVDHLLAALIGLVLTLAAILASLALGLPLVAR
jgi:rhomboid protease GluP